MIGRRVLVGLGLMALIGLCIPRYVDGFTSSAYANAGQMVALVWAGFWAGARFGLKNDPRFARVLMSLALLLCAPPLVYHVFDAYVPMQTVGNFILLAGILFYSYGALLRREPIQPRTKS